MKEGLMIRREFFQAASAAVLAAWARTAFRQQATVIGAAGSTSQGGESRRESPVKETAPTIDDGKLLQKVLQIHRYVGDRMIHPKTNMIYNNILWEADDRWGKADFESAEQVRTKEASNPPRANVEDCAIRAGEYLSALADRCDVTGSSECARQARRVFRRAKTLYEVSPRKGFIVRGVHPADAVSHLLN